MTKSLAVVVAVNAVSLLLLSGCGGGSSLSPSGASATLQSPGTIAPNGARDLVYISDQLQKAVLAFPASEHAQNPPPVQTLIFSVVTEGVWVDRHGILYVGLGPTQSLAGKIEEFEPGASIPFRTITGKVSDPQNLFVDSKGTLYVDQIYGYSARILEYPPGQNSPTKMLLVSDKGKPAPGGMTLDKQGNIYIHVLFRGDPPSRVYEFPSGKTTAEDLQLNGLGDTTGLSSDAQGNLYVSDATGGISVYTLGQKNPSREIVPPAGEYFDGFVATRRGKLYVGQGQTGLSQASLLEYAAGGTQPVNVLSGYLQGPFSVGLRSAAF